MNVPVEHEHAFRAESPRVRGGDRGVVEQTEAHRCARARVVTRGTQQSDAERRLPSRQPFGDRQRATRRTSRRRDRARRDEGVGVEGASFAGPLAQSLEVGGCVHARELVVARIAGRQGLEGDGFPQRVDGAPRHEQALGAFRMRLARAVLEEQIIIHEQHCHARRVTQALGLVGSIGLRR